MNAVELKIGHKVKFGNDPQYWWFVRAVRHPYVILMTENFGFYTIVDIEENIRGSGTSWGLGHACQADIDMSMLALFEEHPGEIRQEISRRNNVPVEIIKTEVLSGKKICAKEQFFHMFDQARNPQIISVTKSNNELLIEIEYKYGDEVAYANKDQDEYTFTYKNKISNIGRKAFDQLYEKVTQ